MYFFALGALTLLLLNFLLVLLLASWCVLGSFLVYSEQVQGVTSILRKFALYIILFDVSFN